MPHFSSYGLWSSNQGDRSLIHFSPQLTSLRRCLERKTPDPVLDRAFAEASAEFPRLLKHVTCLRFLDVPLYIV
jgi:hypothetical protein